MEKILWSYCLRQKMVFHFSYYYLYCSMLACIDWNGEIHLHAKTTICFKCMLTLIDGFMCTQTTDINTQIHKHGPSPCFSFSFEFRHKSTPHRTTRHDTVSTFTGVIWNFKRIAFHGSTSEIFKMDDGKLVCIIIAIFYLINGGMTCIVACLSHTRHGPTNGIRFYVMWAYTLTEM